MFNRRRWWWTALALLALIFLARSVGSRASDHVALAASAPMAPAASAVASSAANPWGMALRATAEADQVEVALAAEKAWLLDPKHDAQWCEHGAPRARAARDRWNEVRYQQGGQPVPANAAVEALDETAAAALRRWLARLARRGDAASLAMRDYLTGWLSESAKERSTAQARLLQAGLVSGDSFVSWLAAGQRCDTSRAPASCEAIVNRWLQIEPGSSFALQWQVSLLPETATPQTVELLMAQLAAVEPDTQLVTRYFALLDDIQASEAPAHGLQRAAELILFRSAVYSVALPRQLRFAEACRSPASMALRQHCAELAKKTVSQWTGLLHYLVAASFLSDDNGHPTSHRDEADAIRGWLKRSMRVRRDEDAALASGSCTSLASWQQQLQRIAQVGEPQAYLERMRAEGVDIPALAAEFRAEQALAEKSNGQQR